MRSFVSSVAILSSASMASNATSSIGPNGFFDLSVVNNLGFVVSWTGTSVTSGSISFMVTNDYVTSASYGSVTQIAGAAGTVSISLPLIPFNAIQTKYTANSGSGTINAVLWAST